MGATGPNTSSLKQDKMHMPQEPTRNIKEKKSKFLNDYEHHLKVDPSENQKLGKARQFTKRRGSWHTKFYNLCWSYDRRAPKLMYQRQDKH